MTAEELANLVGEEAAMLIMSRHGGQRYGVPKNVTKRITDQIGEKAATVMVREYGGCHVYIPAGRNWRILKLARDGMPIQQIALAMATSAKHAREVIHANGSRADGLSRNAA